MSPLRVAVAGGGLGGLCLAQGLALAGLDVTVHERDESLDARRQGYRLHLDARAGRAIAASVPPPLYALFAATCGVPGTGVTVLNEQLRLLHREPALPAGGRDRFAPESLSTAADRLTLRQVLACGLEGRIRLGSQVRGYEAGAGGVRVILSDGATAEADVLVGADGVGSAVRRQYLPHAAVTDSGARQVCGKTLLTSQTRALLPEQARGGFTAVIGHQAGLATAPMRPRHPPDQAARESGLPARLSPVGDYQMWAVTARRERWPVGDDEFRAMSSPRLREVALTMIRKWDPSLRALVQAAEPDECFPIRIRTAAPVPAWPPSRVTLLGDAIHAMSPARGSGANIALQDAALLSQELTAAAHGERDLLTAIGDYEREMRNYGFAAVAMSAAAESTIVARRHPVLTRIATRRPRRS